MLLNSVSLMVGKAGTMALGFFFWLIAARTFEPHAVGLAAGAVSAMMLCTQLALLGVGSAVITLFPEHIQRPFRLLDTAASMVVASSLVAGGIFLLLASSVFRELSVIASIPLYAALFLAMTVLGTLGILLDQISIALRRGDQVLVRGLLFGSVTVVLLVVLPLTTDATSSLAIFSPWVAAGFAACLLGSIQLWRSLARYRYRARVEARLARQLVRFGLPNYVLTLTERAPGLILPIVVTELLSPRANATWYAVWMMAWVVYIIPISVGLALFAEASHRPDSLRLAVTQGVRSALAIGLLAASGLALFAHFALSLLGPQYADGGTTPLRILVVALVPLVFVQAYFAACRAARNLSEAIVTGVVSAIVSVVAASAAGVIFGLNGMAIAWLATQLVTGAWAVWRLRSISRLGTAWSSVSQWPNADPGTIPEMIAEGPAR